MAGEVDRFADDVYVDVHGEGYGAIPIMAIMELVLVFMEKCQDRKSIPDASRSPTRTQRVVLQKRARRSLRKNGVRRPSPQLVQTLCESCFARAAAIDAEAMVGACEEFDDLLGRDDD